MRSKLVKGKRLSKSEVPFDSWLKAAGYEQVSEMYPGSVSVSSLVYDYLQEFPERQDKLSILESYAKEVGWVSDYQQEDDDENPLDIDPDDDWS